MEALESFWSAMIFPTGNASMSATSSLIFPSATSTAEKFDKSHHSTRVVLGLDKKRQFSAMELVYKFWQLQYSEEVETEQQ